MTAQLRLTLSCQDTVTAGEVPVATVRLVNEGTDRVTVNARLNLFEGDLHLVVVGPLGHETRGTAPFVFDAEPRTVGLPAGAAVESGINVHFTSAGFTFSTPGTYAISVLFDVNPDERLRSNEVLVTYAAPAVVAATPLTSQPEIATSLATGQPTSDEAMEGLTTLGNSGAGRESFLARMALAYDGEPDLIRADTAGKDAPSMLDVALWATAASPPGLNLGGPRLPAVAAGLDSSKTSGVAAILDGTPWIAPM